MTGMEESGRSIVQCREDYVEHEWLFKGTTWFPAFFKIIEIMSEILEFPESYSTFTNYVNNIGCLRRIG
jgi:hypothetical protein